MRIRLVLLAALALACAAPPATRGSGPGELETSGGEATAGAAPDLLQAIRLERRHDGEAHYEARREAWLSNNGAGTPFRFEASSTHDVAPDGAGGYLVESRFAPLVVRDGERVVDPLPADLRGLERIRMEHVVDARSRIVSGPTPSGSGPSASFLDELAEVLRHVRVTFPDHPVRTGERWDGEAVTWDTRPLGWVVLEWRPTFELEQVEDGVARIRWHGEVRAQPFRMMGMSLEGVGEVFGITEVALADGWSGRTDLDIEVGLRPAGASIPPPFRVSAKYIEVVARLP
jgi:hypothetical protein